MNTIKLSEIFEACQGEGRFVGEPTLFIRTSGCTRKCSFCDSKYHTTGKEYKIEDVVDCVLKYRGSIVCFTGGEPLMQRDGIKEIINTVYNKSSRPDLLEFHFETNGDLLQPSDLLYASYISVSPKSMDTARKCWKMYNDWPTSMDIKVVTDLDTVGVPLLHYATILMPLTTYEKKNDIEIRKRVLEYCAQKYVRYSPRVHYEVFGRKRGV